MKHHSKLIAAVSALITANSLNANWQEQEFSSYPQCVPFLANDCRFKLFAEVDYLVFFANQEGLSYSTIANVNSNPYNYTETPYTPYIHIPLTPSTMDEKDQFFENKWSSGVRGTVGFKPANKSWDIRGSYTYFQTSVDPGTTSGKFGQTGEFEHYPSTNQFVEEIDGSGVAVLSSFFPNNSIGILGLGSFIAGPYERIGRGLTSSSNTANWRLNFNLAELNFGREFNVSDDATIRPFLGLRGLWSNQRLHSASSITNDFSEVHEDRGMSTILPLITIQVDSNLVAKTKFNGIGASVGFDSSYEVIDGLDLFGNLTGSLFWGRFTVNQKYFSNVNYHGLEATGAYFIQTPTQNLADEHIDHSHNGSSFNFDVSIGFCYNTWLNCGRNLLTVKFAWEQHLFTNFNQFQNMIINQALGFESDGFALQTRDPNFTFDRNIQRGSLYLSGFSLGIAYTY